MRIPRAVRESKKKECLTAGLFFALALLTALGCGSPHDDRSARTTTAPAPAPTPDPITLRTLIVDSEQIEASAVWAATDACKRSATQWTLFDARKTRSEIGHLREQSLEQLRKLSSAEVVEARRHVEAAVAASEKGCGCLDAVIARLTDPEAKDGLELESLRSLHMCDEDSAMARVAPEQLARCRELEAKIALKKYGQRPK